MAVVVSIDAGTTGVRSMAVNSHGTEVAYAYREFPQHLPRPGWVEHDADEIWHATSVTLAELCGRLDELGETVAAVGITNQRETVVPWRRSTGEAAHRALVWQDTRTAGVCESLEAAGAVPLIRRRTGLLASPYFSGTKMRWLLDNADLPPAGDLVLGTVDTWLIAKLSGQGHGAAPSRSSGGRCGPVALTDVTNASRTLLYDIAEGCWSPEMCDLLGVPVETLPEVRPSSGRFALTGDTTALGAGVPISGVGGDQQSALFGQACYAPGMTKNTYGTGSFVLMNAGSTCPAPAEGLLTTVAWDLGDGAGPVYALEGSVFSTGSTISWLRDGLNLIDKPADLEPLAASAPDSGGVFVVPAFGGLGSPWWDANARGTIIGLTFSSGRAEIARAVVESMALQTRDVVQAMTGVSGVPELRELRVDGGASVMNLMLQIQADQLGVKVSRPRSSQLTALGAAMLAGLAEGVWASTGELAGAWSLDREFSPAADRAGADSLYGGWCRAVERSRGLANA